MNDHPPLLDAARLRAALSLTPFDGRAAQRLMEPEARGRPPSSVNRAQPLRDAAALAYVFEEDGQLRLPLTIRHANLRQHRGQVSLPGGRPDPGETLYETAMREAHEEVALAMTTLEAAEPLGVLHPVDIPVSHSRLHVHVALGAPPEQLVPNPGEVEHIEVIALDDLIDPALRQERVLEIQGRAIDVPYFDVSGLFLWGATAMAMSELAERLRQSV